jgi:hypothetical protein
MLLAGMQRPINRNDAPSLGNIYLYQQNHFKLPPPKIARTKQLMQYVLIDFSETRGVLIDGRVGGYTNQVLRVNWGMHTFQLDGPGGYTPPSQTVNVQNTTFLCPMEVAFENT